MNVLGMTDAQWDVLATREIKSAATLWLVGGLVYQWWQGHLFTWASIVLSLGVIIAAPLIAMPLATLDAVKVRQLTQMVARGDRRWWPLVLWTPWVIIKLACPILLAIGALKLMGSR